MKRSECGFATPPVDGSPERELMDRFADFLRAVGPAPTREDIERRRLRSPASRYRIRYLAWRVSRPAD